MATSYDRVSRHICEHMFFVNYLSVLRGRLESYKIQRVNFSMGDDISKVNAYPYGGYDGQNENDQTQIHRLGWEINTFDFATGNEVRAIAKDLFDRKLIPTYNCKWEETKGGPRGQKCLSKHIIDFVDTYVREKLGDEMKAVSARVAVQYEKVFDAKLLADEKAKYVERTAVKEIKAALYKFRHLDEQVIKTALREFVAEDVLSA